MCEEVRGREPVAIPVGGRVGRGRRGRAGRWWIDASNKNSH